MTDFLTWIGAFMAGLLLGLFYFGTLWWTLQRLPHMRHPVPLALGGYAVRIVLSLLVFILLVKSGGWEALLAGLVGFIIMRVVLVRVWGGRDNTQHSTVMEGANEDEHQS